jgi:hypothetical protein
MRSRALFSPGGALAAGAVATLLGLASAGPAGASGHGRGQFTPSGGPPILTSTSCTGFTPLPPLGCAEAGYQASGRDFRYAQAVITVPDHQGEVTVCGGSPVRPGPRRTPPNCIAPRNATSPAGEADPKLYVALDDSSGNSSDFARVGVQPCTGGSDCSSTGWEAFVQIARGFQPPVSPPVGLFPIAAVQEGDAVFVSVYASPGGQAVHTVVTLPDGSTFNDTYTVGGQTYPRAQAVADWTTAEIKPQPLPPSPGKVRDSQFLEGRFTTLNGQQGTFAGPWTLNAFEGLTSAAAPPAGTLVVQPSYLWNDGTNFHGMFGDAFGVWRFPS